MQKKDLVNSIFFPRNSNIEKDSNDVLIKVDKNVEVGVRLFLKDVKFPTIIFFHGNGEIAQEYEEIGQIYNDYKLNFIVCDYRGYGLSNGTPSKENLHSDSIKIFNYLSDYLLNKNYKNKLIIMGRSLGSCSAFEIVSKYSDIISGCIIESGFVTEYPLLHLMGMDPEEISFDLTDGFMNLSKVKKFKGPLLIIHADLDDIVPLSQAELMLIESGSQNKELFKVNGANHNNIMMVARMEYFNRIYRFIEQV